jgi:hypothetical protein
MRFQVVMHRSLVVAAVVLPVGLILYVSCQNRRTSPRPVEALGVTLEAFERIRTGMTFLDVQRIIGELGIDVPGTYSPFRTESFGVEIYGKWKMWRSSEDENKWIAVSFVRSLYVDFEEPTGNGPYAFRKEKSGF